MICYQRRLKRILRVRDIFFAHEGQVKAEPGDVDFYIQAAVPIAGAQPFRTLHIALDRPTEEVWLEIGSNCRYKIRRAQERDGVTVELTDRPDAELIAQFADYYDRFARGAALTPANRERLFKLGALGALAIGQAHANGEALTRHAHVCDGQRWRLLYSASLFRENADSEARNRVGRANRLLHWEEIRRAQAGGCRLYDFGGLSTDGATAGVDRFKLEFGGAQVTEFNSICAVSTLGHVAVWVDGLRARLRH